MQRKEELNPFGFTTPEDLAAAKVPPPPQSNKDEESADDGQADVVRRERSLSSAVSTQPRGASSTSSSSETPPNYKKRQLSRNASDAGVFLSPASSSSTSKISCLECRNSKTRCSGGEPCQRCERLERQCVYKEHRRGRFSDSKRVQHLEKTVQTLLTQLRTLTPSSSSSQHQVGTTSSSSSSSDSKGPPTVTTIPVNNVQPLPASADRTRTVGSTFSIRTTARSPSATLPVDDVHSAAASTAELLSRPLPFMFRTGFNLRTTAADGHRSTASSFLSGLSESLHDRFDPIEMELINLTHARALFNFFFQRIQPNVMLFDPVLHTFEYVRSRSSLLFCSILFIATLFDEAIAAEQISHDMEAHIYHLILPEVIVEAYRSVEIVQALLLLALYQPTSDDSMVSGRSYKLIGLAEQMSSHLDLAGTSSSSSTSAIDDQMSVRHTRNAVRTWLNVWIGERTLSERMGRRSLLRADACILSSAASWHRHSLATQSDAKIIRIVQMNLLVVRQHDSAQQIVAQQHNVVVPTSIRSFWKNGLEQLDSWLFAWSNCSPLEALPVANSSNAAAAAELSGVKLEYWYARVSFTTLSLRLPSNESDKISLHQDLYRDAFHSCTAFVQTFVQTVVPARLSFGGHDNEAIVRPAYISIVCLHILTSMRKVAIEAWNVNVNHVFAQIQQLVDALDANVMSRRRGLAGRFASLIRAVLQQSQSHDEGQPSFGRTPPDLSMSISAQNEINAQQKAMDELVWSSNVGQNLMQYLQNVPHDPSISSFDGPTTSSSGGVVHPYDARQQELDYRINLSIPGDSSQALPPPPPQIPSESHQQFASRPSQTPWTQLADFTAADGNHSDSALDMLFGTFSQQARPTSSPPPPPPAPLPHGLNMQSTASYQDQNTGE